MYKISFELKDFRSVLDDSYNAEKGTMVDQWVTLESVHAEVSMELARKISQAVHRLISEEL